MQCHSQTVGHMKSCDETTTLHKNIQCHSQTFGHRQRCDETAFCKMCNVTHLLLAIGKDVMNHETALQCHSLLAVGHRKRCDGTAFHKMCNVTHLLLVIGKDMMRPPFTKCAMSLTFYWS